MRFLVDGYNLLWVFPPLRTQMIARDSAGARRGLVALLARLVRSGTLKPPVQVVFDGRADRGSAGLSIPGVVEVRFAPHPATADSLIVETIASADQPGDFTVVSSDREVQSRVRQRGAAVIGVGSFTKRYVPPRRQPARQRADEEKKGAEKPSAALEQFEVEEWLREFGLE